MLPQTLQISIFVTPAIYLSRCCLDWGVNLGPKGGPKSAQRGSPSPAPPFHTGAPSNHDFAQEMPIRENKDLDRLKSKTVNNFLNLFRSDGGNDGER